ncbi:MAG: DNA methyltransferase, partial [Verrucomicrobiia bacterium]
GRVPLAGVPHHAMERYCAQLVERGYVQLQTAWDNTWTSETAYLDWSTRWLRAAARVLRPDGLLYLFGQPGKREQAFLRLMPLATSILPFHDLLIWDRVVGANERRDSFTPCYEMILVLRGSHALPYFNKDAVREPYDPATIHNYLRDKRYKNPDARRAHLTKGKFATNLWRIPSLKGSSKEKIGHPSQKPLALIERIILSSSRPGDLVLDPFLGSGSTAEAALRHHRRFAGCDSHAPYLTLARSRLRHLSTPPNPS